PDTDLLTQDTARAEATSGDTSLNGATIWITSSGQVGYDASTLTGAFKSQLQGLSAGETLTDSFTYAIRMGNGTLSWTTATVQFMGENDAPVIAGVTNGAIHEQADVTGSTTPDQTTAQVTFTDL